MAYILVVDDEEPVRSTLRQMLERAGYTVGEAADGDEALHSYRKRRPDLVITDILMPNKGGLVTIKEIQALDAEARFIAISGGGRTGRLSFLSTARTFQGVRTLKKPFRRAELLSLVEESLSGAAGEEA